MKIANIHGTYQSFVVCYVYANIKYHECVYNYYTATRRAQTHTEQEKTWTMLLCESNTIKCYLLLDLDFVICWLRVPRTLSEREGGGVREKERKMRCFYSIGSILRQNVNYSELNVLFYHLIYCVGLATSQFKNNIEKKFLSMGHLQFSCHNLDCLSYILHYHIIEMHKKKITEDLWKMPTHLIDCTVNFS